MATNVAGVAVAIWFQVQQTTLLPPETFNDYQLYDRSKDMLPLRITLDASHTACSGKNTGIERVVRNLSQQFASVAREQGIHQTTIATHIGDDFFPVDERQRRAMGTLSRWEANAVNFVPPWIQAGPQFFARTLGTRNTKKWMEPAPSHLGIYKSAHHAYKMATQASRWLRGGALVPSERDVLILPDAYWTKKDIWEAVKRYRDAGAFVASIVYDLIPLTHPEYVGTKRSTKFRGYLDELIGHSDAIVAISKTVRDEVREYIDHRPAVDASRVQVHAFTLGAELRSCEGAVRENLKRLFSPDDSKTPYLMVASFDPRKNHAQALDAFELLWRDDPSLKLCFAGRAGNACSELIARIQNHPLYQRSLFAIHDMTDAELQYAYRGCSGVLLPSIVEGFGLPIVESLWHGKKTFASDTPIHREVGGTACEYFALHDVVALKSLICRWEQERHQVPTERNWTGAQNASERFLPANWQQSARQLLEVVLECYQRRQQDKKPSRQAA
jgi:alpha-1,2-rhamnosyltransferase